MPCRAAELLRPPYQTPCRPRATSLETASRRCLHAVRRRLQCVCTLLDAVCTLFGVEEEGPGPVFTCFSRASKTLEKSSNRAWTENGNYFRATPETMTTKKINIDGPTPETPETPETSYGSNYSRNSRNTLGFGSFGSEVKTGRKTVADLAPKFTHPGTRALHFARQPFSAPSSASGGIGQHWSLPAPNPGRV